MSFLSPRSKLLHHAQDTMRDSSYTRIRSVYKGGQLLVPLMPEPDASIVGGKNIETSSCSLLFRDSSHVTPARSQLTDASTPFWR
jgi:hypothetical protein